MGKPWPFKTDPEPFQAVWSGAKTAEYRDLSDREPIEAGDWLTLWEYSGGLYTGRSIEAEITHIQTGYGMPEGHAMLSLDNLLKFKTAQTNFKTVEELQQHPQYQCDMLRVTK